MMVTAKVRVLLEMNKGFEQCNFSTPSKWWVCPDCGMENQKGRNRCIRCGTTRTGKKLLS